MRSHIQKILQEAVLSGGKQLKKYFNNPKTEISQKTDHHNLVTTADKASEKAIIQSINNNIRRLGYSLSDYDFISEETELMPVNTSSKYLFIIDPLDGTSNFATGLPMFSITIGVWKETKAIAGIVYDPIQNESYYADKYTKQIIHKQGIKTNKLLKKECNNLFKKILLTNLSNNDETRKQMSKMINLIFSYLRSVRILGYGSIDIIKPMINQRFIYLGRGYIWDIAGAQAIYSIMKKTIYDWSGIPIKLNFNDRSHIYQTLACHPDEKDNIIKIINK